MAEKRSQGGRIRFTAADRAKFEQKEKERDSGQETLHQEPDGYHFAEQVASAPSDTFSVEEAPKARTEENQISAPPVNLSPDSLQLAALALGVTNSAVVVMFGQECGLYDTEKKLLYPSLSRVINRMPATSAAKASVFIDPLVLLLGLAVWGNRIASIKSRQRAEVNSVTAREFATASGINWDVSRQQPNAEPNSTPGEAGRGTVGTVPEAGPDSVNANGVVGKVPDIITNSRNDDITGGN